MARIYLASSWRNEYQPEVVKFLRSLDHEVYDFRDPQHSPGFQWSELDPKWQSWTVEAYRERLLSEPRAAQGFMSDLRGMMWADTGVLLLPCGASAHSEVGWMAGFGKRTIVYIPFGVKWEPELMYLMHNEIVASEYELDEALGRLHPNVQSRAMF